MVERLGNDSRKLAMWAAYSKREPFGYARHNMHAILQVSAFSKVSDPQRLMFGDRHPEMLAMFRAAQAARQERDNG